MQAFNEWLYDDWTYDYEGRIFATPIVTPCMLDEGIAELELRARPRREGRARSTRSGRRSARPPLAVPPGVRSLLGAGRGAGVVVALHASDSGYQDYLNTWEGTSGEYVAFRPKTFAYVADGGRSIQDSLASAICHGMLDRFPGVKLISVENGGQLGRISSRRTSSSRGRRCPTSSPRTRSRCSSATCGSTRSGRSRSTSVVELMGADRVCFGSDYPHPEGLAEPLSFAAELEGMPAADVERIMSTNMFELLGLPRPAIATEA